MHWLFLALAILLEVIGVSILNAFRGWEGITAMCILICLSYYVLSIAVRKIPIGIAYATWEGVGIMLISLIAISFFDEQLSIQKLCGLVLAMIGIVMVNLGEVHPEKAAGMKMKDSR